MIAALNFAVGAMATLVALLWLIVAAIYLRQLVRDWPLYSPSERCMMLACSALGPLALFLTLAIDRWERRR